jgi:hypothetical protein
MRSDGCEEDSAISRRECWFRSRPRNQRDIAERRASVRRSPGHSACTGNRSRRMIRRTLRATRSISSTGWRRVRAGVTWLMIRRAATLVAVGWPHHDRADDLSLPHCGETGRPWYGCCLRRVRQPSRSLRGVEMAARQAYQRFLRRPSHASALHRTAGAGATTETCSPPAP